MARILPADQSLEEASRLLLAGELVAIPTETVYGLAADATQGRAVARIFEAKGRPSFNPLIAHVADLEMAARIGRLERVTLRLAEHFWPGPLTLVVEQRADSPVHPLVTAGLASIALRMPRGIAREISAHIARPLAAPSANPSGRLSATSAAAVQAGLGDRIALIVDGGPAEIGVESTIVRVESGGLRILRPGGLTAEEIESVASTRILPSEQAGGIIAPGMMASHYAPSAAMRLDAREILPGEALLAFGGSRAARAERAIAILNLSERGDLTEAAANLYAHLGLLDKSGAATIAVEPIPHVGLGVAINDRLARAAAPRDGSN